MHDTLFLLNAPVLTDFGDFRFVSLSLAEAQNLIREFAAAGKPIESAIGHTATAEIVSELLQYEVAPNRVEVRQQVAEAALVFKLKARLPEGQVLERTGLENIGYEFGLLTRLA